MAAVVYRDPAAGDEMDNVFVPYGLVSRITLSTESRSKRELGFRLDRVPEVRSEDR